MKHGGRAKGTPNKRTAEAIRILEEVDFCPIRKHVRIYNIAMQNFEIDHSDFKFKYLEIAQGASKDLMPYLYPKLKAIEHSGDDSFASAVIITREAVEKALADDPMMNEPKDATNGIGEPGAREIEALLELPSDEPTAVES